MKADSLEQLEGSDLDKPKDKVSNTELEQMIRKFEEDTEIVKQLKIDNKDLKRKIDALMQNNMKFAELVRKLEERSNRVRIEKEKELIYSYQDGAMVKNAEIGKHRMRLQKKKLTLNEINSQLAEILTELENEEKLD
jgi:hypothetical protein